MPAAFSLHVLPPAFSLPSIDAECLAAIAYLTWALPHQSWTIVAESGLAENQQLPCLRDISNGKRNEEVVHGFEAIVRHLVRVSRGAWDLNASLGKFAKADCAAFTSHLTQALSPLVDLSLYVCAENYDTTTRAAFGSTLSFPDSWVVPPQRQKIAHARTSHLGIDPVSLYNPNPQPSPTRSSRSPSGSPIMQTTDTPGATSTKGSGYFGTDRGRSLAEHAVTSARLTALIEEALRPLATLYESNDRRYLLSDSPSTLDCHALALLSLALLPSLSNPFLANGFAKFERLETYTRATLREALGPPVTASDALVRAPAQDDVDDENADDDSAIDLDSYQNANIGSGEIALPWRRARRSTGAVVAGIVQAVIG